MVSILVATIWSQFSGMRLQIFVGFPSSGARASISLTPIARMLMPCCGSRARFSHVRRISIRLRVKIFAHDPRNGPEHPGSVRQTDWRSRIYFFGSLGGERNSIA